MRVVSSLSLSIVAIKANTDWTCHQWTKDEAAEIAGGIAKLDVCEAAGNVWTHGDNDDKPGCGTCYCCTPLDFSAPVFANMFQGRVVLQRDTTVAIWGSAGSGGVALYLDGTHAADAAVDSTGQWSAQLFSPGACFGHTLVAKGAAGNTTITVSFGDVVLCSGQSNMEMPVVAKAGAFQADNGTAEQAAVSRYANGISLWKQMHRKRTAAWKTASSLNGFSAVCWYTGKALFEHYGGDVPVGLMMAAVGGTPIEYWISKETLDKCEVDKPQCDPNSPDSIYHDDQIVSLQPYTLGAIVWDQGERDLKCGHVDEYPCMLQGLARSWRQEFMSPHAALVVVQLPDYYDPADPGATGHPGYNTMAEGLFQMRLSQEAGIEGAEPGVVVATYDQSCNDLAYAASCPWGSVHNPRKQEVGRRAAMQLARLMRGEQFVIEGPRAQSAVATPMGTGTSGFSVAVRFSGGAKPFSLMPVRNCTECCDVAARGDFDVSHDGVSWLPGSNVRMHGEDSIMFNTNLPHSDPPVFLRYTGGSNFTQCALFNKESLPAVPFQHKVELASANVMV